MVIDPTQLQEAEEILSIVSMLLESEVSPNLDIFSVKLPNYISDNRDYKIESTPTLEGNYLTVEAKEGRLLIEMLDGQVKIAEGIEDEDRQYWQKMKEEIYECPQNKNNFH